MKRIISAFVIAAAIPGMLSGCMAGAMIKKNSIAETGRIAVVSVVFSRVADTARDGNRVALQSFAEKALDRVKTGLKSVHNWIVIDTSGYKGGKTVLSIVAVSDEEISSMFPSGGEHKTSRRIINRELARWKTDFIGVRGLPIVPRSALVQAKNDKTALAQIPPVMQEHAAKLCRELNVDAVAFVHVLARIDHPRPKTFIVSNNRTDGAIHVVQTIVIVDKKGEIIADMGMPELDNHARMRDLLPLYAGKGEAAVKQENIDLGDPQNKIVTAFSALIDESADDMIEILKEKAAR